MCGCIHMYEREIKFNNDKAIQPNSHLLSPLPISLNIFPLVSKSCDGESLFSPFKKEKERYK